MWKVVEIKAEEVRMTKGKGKRKEGRSWKEERRKGREEGKRETKERT